MLSILLYDFYCCHSEINWRKSTLTLLRSPLRHDIHRLSSYRYSRGPLSRDMLHTHIPLRGLILDIEELLIWLAFVDWWESNLKF